MTPRDASSIAATWLGLAAALIGGYATFFQFRESVNKQVDDRSTAAINFVIQFQTQHMLPIREKVYNHIFCTSDCAAKQPSATEIFAFVEFFDSVQYCADKGICDAHVIRDVFSPYATWHWPCLSRTVQAVRTGESKLKLARPYGYGLEKLVAADVGTAHCGNLRASR